MVDFLLCLQLQEWAFMNLPLPGATISRRTRINSIICIIILGLTQSQTSKADKMTITLFVIEDIITLKSLVRSHFHGVRRILISNWKKYHRTVLMLWCHVQLMRTLVFIFELEIHSIVIFVLKLQRDFFFYSDEFAKSRIYFPLTPTFFSESRSYRGLSTPILHNMSSLC